MSSNGSLPHQIELSRGTNKPGRKGSIPKAAPERKETIRTAARGQFRQRGSALAAAQDPGHMRDGPAARDLRADARNTALGPHLIDAPMDHLSQVECDSQKSPLMAGQALRPSGVAVCEA